MKTINERAIDLDYIEKISSKSMRELIEAEKLKKVIDDVEMKVKSVSVSDERYFVKVAVAYDIIGVFFYMYSKITKDHTRVCLTYSDFNFIKSTTEGAGN